MNNSVCLECKSGWVVRVMLAFMAALDVSKCTEDQEVIEPEIDWLYVCIEINSAFRDW